MRRISSGFADEADQGRMVLANEDDDADDAAGNTTKIRVNLTGNNASTTACGTIIKQKHRPPSSQQHHPSRPLQPHRQQRRQSSFLMQHINSSSRRSKILLRQSSQSFHTLLRKSSSLIENINQNYLPSSPTGWSLFTLALASLGLQYELHVQKQLTASPIVFCQTSCGTSSCRSILNTKMDRLFRMLSCINCSNGVHNNNIHLETPPVENGDGGGGSGILARKVTPSLIIGTRGIMSSVAAYAFGDHEAGLNDRGVKRVREVMKMGADGAVIVLDWEIPTSSPSSGKNIKHSEQPLRDSCDVTMPNSIDKPVILLLHGMNNDSSFGYIRSMMRTATERGWIAVCMNLRGQDGCRQVKNTTPRGYNAGYTGDLRGVVQQIQHRLRRKEEVSSHRNQFNQKEFFRFVRGTEDI